MPVSNMSGPCLFICSAQSKSRTLNSFSFTGDYPKVASK